MKTINMLHLSTPRLQLKGLTPEDMDRIFTTMNKAEIMQLLGHKTDEEYEKEADKQKKGYAAYNRTFILFLLEDKASGKIVGRAGLHNWNKEHFRA
ncbi:MAG: GNAT family N-acetyltransferase, partial [Bdellovibrionaceae bacterium]|nr:GNAT family N-acetyltransferase [Pseudobdellovibrionaceae bacterium]